MQNNSSISSVSRLASMLLDHFIMSIIALSFSIPVFILTFSNAFQVSHEDQDNDIFGGHLFYFSLIGFALYFCKDVIDARSPGKRILKSQVVNISDELPATPIKCIVRNIFCIFWPIEVMVTLFSPSRRIGDFVAGTKVIPYEARTGYKPDFKQIGLSVVLTYAFMLIVSYPFLAFNDVNKPRKISFIKESFNQVESTKLDNVISESLHLKSDSRVYDKIEGEDLKYVSVIVMLDKNLLNDDGDYNNLLAKFEPLLTRKYPDSTFTGKVKFVYKTDNSMQTRIETYDWRESK